MQASLQFLGAGTPDGGAKSVMLNIEGHRYLFNCSAGTQRCALQHGIKLARIKTVFFTQLVWKNIGGFKGLAATLADLEPPLGAKIKIVGPLGLVELFAASQPFLKRAAPFLELIEVTEAFEFDDGLVKVLGLPDGGNVSYLVHGPKVPGVFDAAKAKALGLKPGPIYKQLLAGQSVMLGELGIKPEDVIAPSKPFPRILVTEKPQAAADCDIMVCYDSLGLDRSIKAAVYNIPPLSFEPAIRDSMALEQQLSEQSPQFHSPLHHISESHDVKPLDEHILLPQPQLIRQPLMAPVSASLLSIDEQVVVTLGTGGSMPGKYRNVSSTLLNLRDMKGLFDCGEATAGQLIRKYGPQSQQLIDGLDFIAVSHLHSDHHLGLLGILEARSQGGASIVHVLIPRAIYVFVAAYMQITGQTFPNAQFTVLEDTDGVDLSNSYRLQSVPADHCDGACGFLLWRGDQKIIGYSGDTRPCSELIEAFRGVQVVVHEATMPDDLMEEAVFRKHCTIQEAIDVVRQVSPSKAAILTHLSQRFGKELPALQDKVIMASDFMHCPLDAGSYIQDDPTRHRILLS